MKTKHGRRGRPTGRQRSAEQARPKPHPPKAPRPAPAEAVAPVARRSPARGRTRRGRSGVAGRGHRLATGVGRRVGAVPHLDAVLLRTGLAFVFTYASLASFADPERFQRYVPSMVAHPWVTHWCLPVFSTFELVLAAALVTGRRLVLASTIAAVTVGAITVSNPSHFDVLFRNVAIAFAALALAVRSREQAQSPATVIVLPD